MAWEGRKRPTQADHNLPATATSLFKSSANDFLQRKSAKNCKLFFKEKLDQMKTLRGLWEAPMEGASQVGGEASQWKVGLAEHSF